MDRPFTDGKCLYASYKVREYREYNDDNKNDQWRTIFSKTLAPPFYLDDGTGEMLVDADSGLLSSVRSTVDTVTDMVESVSGPRAVSGSSRRKRRYVEEVLPVGADTYVYGSAQPRDTDLSAANEDRLVMREDQATEQFIVSDFSEDEISWGYTKRAVLFILGGLILSAGSLGGLAYLLGSTCSQTVPACAPRGQRNVPP